MARHYAHYICPSDLTTLVLKEDTEDGEKPGEFPETIMCKNKKCGRRMKRRDV